MYAPNEVRNIEDRQRTASFLIHRISIYLAQLYAHNDTDGGWGCCLRLRVILPSTLAQDPSFSSSRAGLQGENRNSGARFQFPYPSQVGRLWNMRAFVVGVQSRSAGRIDGNRVQHLPSKPDFPFLLKPHWALVDGARMRAHSYLPSTVGITEHMPVLLRNIRHPTSSLKTHRPSLVACDSCDATISAFAKDRESNAGGRGQGQSQGRR
ncbi:hypothetical protein CVT25_000361 [Psilocybe cyanescens]|uniref:Uncharacterized protein n=1 Tax=Psilocybe cyanescens TaxID=93625 RepID=A0A409X3I4_PSICY|nr:hypothetical protein CVT25_000361 [Psilocybe cyanescens]